MPRVSLDGVGIEYREAGSGFPLVLAHEFGGSMESWEPQVRFFSRRYRVITYNARGYPPSDVPDDPDAYSQDRAVEDLYQLLGHLSIEQAHVGGISMGGGMAVHFGLRHPEMARSLIVASTGSGSTNPEQFAQVCEERATRFEREGMDGADDYTRGADRIQLLRKDPVGWAEFAELFGRHSPIGAAHTLRGVQVKRGPIFAVEEQLRALQVPTLILAGDEDEPCLEPSLFLKRCISRSGLALFPQSGHTINLEEPALFNDVVLDFLTAVEAGRWAARGAEDWS